MEDQERLKQIKNRVAEDGADGDKQWLLEHIEEALGLERLFALQQTRMAEATKVWREATGKRDVLPDLGDLLAWLLDNRRAPDPRVAALVEAAKTGAAKAIATWGANQALGVKQRSLAEVVMAVIDEAALYALEDK